MMQDSGQKSSDNEPNYRLKFILSGHMRPVSSLKFSPDGSILASAGEPMPHNSFYVFAKWSRRKGADKLIKLWDVETGDIIYTLQGHTEGISDIAWASDGEHLASASDDKTIKIWNMEEVSLWFS